MTKRYSLQIAGHVLSVTGNVVPDIVRNMYAFSIFATALPAQWEVAFMPDVQTKVFNKLHTFDLEQYTCTYGNVGDIEVLEIAPPESCSATFYLNCRRGESRVEATQTTDTTVLRFALWFAFNLLAVPHGLFAIHSSTVVCNGRANLFLGESGTGKSTHTRLWLNNIAGAKLLNDDSPIIAVEDDKVMAYGSPWSGKTPCYHNVGFPVNAFVRLRQEKANNIHKLRPLQGFAALQPSTPPALSYSSYYSSKIISLLDVILQRCPVYQLGCLPNVDAATLSYNTLYNK